MSTHKPLQFIAQILYPACERVVSNMASNTQNDNENKPASTGKPSFGTGLYLGSADIGILIFSSLMINLFSLAVPLVTLQVYDRILSFQSVGTLQVLTLGVGIIVILDIVLRLCRSSLIGWTAACFEHNASTKILSHLMKAKLPALQALSSGEQLQRMGAIAKVKSFYSGQSLISLIDLPFVLVFLGFIAYLAHWLVLVPLVLLGSFSLYALYLGHNMKKNLLLRDGEEDQRINFISEVLDHIHTIKMLGLEQAFQRRHEELQARNIHDSHLLSEHNIQAYNAASLFTQIMMIATVSIGALMVLDDAMTMGVLIACVLLSGRIMQPVQRSLSFWIGFQEFKLGTDKLNELLMLPAQETIPSTSLKLPKGRLEIKALNFAYDDKKPVFQDLNLKLAPGKTIALSGPPGDGKTSLMQLIAGLYNPDSGQILIDGQDAAHIPKDMLAQYVGYLPPDSDLFQGTIMENLTSFRPELEDQALEMAQYLGIDKVVSKLAAGYQTQLFDGPADPLTPGMKQRLTIGRILVNKPRILLFDHADKSLDKDGYNHLFRLLGQLVGQATMVLVSNDRNILHLAQDHYFIKNGTMHKSQMGEGQDPDNLIRPFKELHG